MRTFSTLSGPLNPVNKSSTAVRFRPVNHADGLVLRSWVRLIAYGSLVCTIAYGLVLFWPTHWVALTAPDPLAAAADWTMLGCLLTLQFFVLTGTYAAVRATVTARNPVPLKPVAGLRVAFVTTRAPGEPVGLVETTLRAAKEIVYTTGTVDVWLLDETDSRELKDLCREIGVRYFTRARDERWNQVKPPRQGLLRWLMGGRSSYDPRFAARTKHGNFNGWLAYVAERAIEYDIVAGVDTDQVPHRNYLQRLLGYFHDPDIAYVVGPQVYGNYRPGRDGRVTRWSESQASFFQAAIQRAANKSGSAMFVGTNYAVRMDVLRQVGGFQPCITEDMATGLVIHANTNLRTGNRWRSVYTPDVLAIGEGPNGWGSYFTQQWRWAAGTFDAWKRIVGRTLPRFGFARAFHYLLILSFYPIVALTWLLAVLSAGLYLVTGASAVTTSLTHVLTLYLASAVLQLSLYFWNRRFNVSPHEPRGSLGLSGMAMTALTGPVYLSAFVGMLTGRRNRFVVTKKGGTGNRDTFATFKLYISWLILITGLAVFGATRGHVNVAMLLWAGLLAVLCIVPIVLGVRIRTASGRRSQMMVQRTVV